MCLRGHTGLVKGLTWDPVGKYIASQADDHSLKVWRTVDWQMEANITKPFSEVQKGCSSQLCVMMLWEQCYCRDGHMETSASIMHFVHLLLLSCHTCIPSCPTCHRHRCTGESLNGFLSSVCVSVWRDNPCPASVLVSRWSVPGVSSRHEQLGSHRSDRGEGRLED